MNIIDASVTAIIVAYRPELDALEALVSILSTQVTHIYLIDNSTPDDAAVTDWFERAMPPSTSLVKMGNNLGIATALNAGIRCARAAHATHVLLSDQDSLPDAEMVPGLLRAFMSLDGQPKIAAVGPVFIDRNTGVIYPFQCWSPGRFLYRHTQPTATSPIIETLGLITSGCLVSMAALDDVGDMREDFFIDYVDSEWCQRARARGWHLYSTNMARMTHNAGDGALRVWFFGWRSESAYSPLRMYYRTRNFIALCRLRYIPIRWKIRSTWYWLGVMYTQGCYGRERKATWHMVARGILDGLRNRMGVYGWDKRLSDTSSNARRD